ncbi:MAG: hypothetical protein WBM40_21405 [Thiohalocapsa sp.]
MQLSIVALALSPLLIGCSDAPDRSAQPDQLEKLNQVVERFPALEPARRAANADGVITEHEIIGIFEQAQALAPPGG